MFSVAEWCQWSRGRLEGYLDQVNETLHARPKPAALPVRPTDVVRDVYEDAPKVAPTRVRDTARITELRAQLDQATTQRRAHQRGYTTAALLTSVSALAAAGGLTLCSSPFTLPMGLLLFGGGFFGMLTFFPRTAEYKEAAAQAKVACAMLQGQLMEAER